MSKGESTRNYHSQLNAILADVIAAQQGHDNRLCNVILNVGDEKLFVSRIYCPVLFVIGDNKSNDTLTARYGSHTSSVHRHCRACTVMFEELDDPDVQCRCVAATKIQQLTHDADENVLQQISQHVVDNAFDNICFGGDIQGIYGATLTDLMHVLQLGIMKYCLSTLFGALTTQQQDDIDSLAMNIKACNQQSTRKQYPRASLAKGLTNLANLTAQEITGVVFMTCILLQSDVGWQVLHKALNRKSNIEFGSKDEVLECLEGLLCFQYWTMQAEYWQISQRNTAKHTTQIAIHKLLIMIKTAIPQQQGNKWRIVPKFDKLATSC